MTDPELTPSETPDRDIRPEGAPAPSDTPVHDQPTAAGQVPEDSGSTSPALPADDEAAEILRNEERP
jgi:hypothetical protein